MLARLARAGLESWALPSLRCVHIAPNCPEQNVLPLIGEVPAPIVASQKPFWRKCKQVHTPEPFQHSVFPEHYDHLPVLYAAFRKSQLNGRDGTWSSRKLRRMGLTPGILDSLPISQPPIQLVFPTAQINTAFKQFGASFSNRLSMLQIVDVEELEVFNKPAADSQAAVERHGRPHPLHTFQVLPRRISCNPVTGNLLGITMMNCPSRRIVTNNVPVVPKNADESPCAKRGGFPLVTSKVLRVRSLATNIPLQLEIDCATLEIGDCVFVRDLTLPQGQLIVGPSQSTCLIKMDIGTG